MSRRRALAVGALVGLALLGVAIAVLTPWHPLGADVPVRPDVAGAFTPAEVQRAAAFRDALGAWPYVALVLSVAVPWVVFAVLLRRRDRSAPTAPPRRAWPVVVATVVVVLALQWLVALPSGIRSEQVLRDVHLSTQTWAGWLRDEAVGWAMNAALTTLGLLVVWWVMRRAPRRWPWLLAAGAAVVTVLGSVLYPLVVEPAYNHFTPLPESALTRSISALAARDGIAHVRVVVSDASARTTGENAHVSGLGSTRWVVLDDTTLARAKQDPAAVLAVVAHEFGHVKAQDVLVGTLLGAVGAATGVLALGWLLTGTRGRRWLDPRATGRRSVARGTALLLAVVATAPWLGAPVTNLVSRHIEARADVHSLDLTRDVGAFERMQHDLAVTDLSRLEPTWWQTALFATHPDPAWRIAQARAWQELHR
ncbi:MAG: M48 family metalloprotease [Oryzihumus sp.]|jgi:STE24 endopeptidase